MKTQTFHHLAQGLLLDHAGRLACFFSGLTLLLALAAPAWAQITPDLENQRRARQAEIDRKNAERQRQEAIRRQEQAEADKAEAQARRERAEREKADALARAIRAEEELAKLKAAQEAQLAAAASQAGATASQVPSLTGVRNRIDSSIDPIGPGFSAANCKATVPTEKLRHGFSYRFFDQVTNPNEFLEYRFVGLPRVFYSEEYDYNGSNQFPAFGWTEMIREKQFILPARQSVRFTEANASYPIVYRPKKRHQANFSIAYSAEFYARKSSSENWRGPYYTFSCQKYEITWCGDGIVDTPEGEECDDGEQNSELGRCGPSCRKRP